MSNMYTTIRHLVGATEEAKNATRAFNDLARALGGTPPKVTRIAEPAKIETREGRLLWFVKWIRGLGW